MPDYLTGPEATQRYCPMLMAGFSSLSLCRASECMAWRTLNQTHANNEPPPVPRGYCGLAGNPHPAYIMEKR